MLRHLSPPLRTFDITIRKIEAQVPFCGVSNQSKAEWPHIGTLESGVETMTDRVEINPGVMQGKPVIRGTRIPIELLLRKLAEGATI
jgi:hypothetical protein